MKITLTGSLGNIGKPLTIKLLEEGHEVSLISSSEARRSEITALGAKPLIGSVEDAAFLTEAFSGADALFAMTPPNLGGANVIENTVNAGKAFAAAIKQSGVKRVVMLSSIGADQPAGTGPIKGLHQIEAIYNDIDGIALTKLRAGYFYTNFFNDIPLIKGMGIMGGNFPAETLIPLVHPTDIATAAAAQLLSPKEDNEVTYIVSELNSAVNIATTLGTAIGKPELPWVEFTDEQSLDGMTQAGLPAEIAALYTEMGQGLKKGLLQSDFQAKGSPIDGKTKLADFANEFSAAF
ncbi:NAD(P)H-binding protein [Pedobacter aquatilis]|uniref:NAD(P)H-binding protein n=1 Tax=Pedobacter aquatilis TaxID=351343 RepID=UPI00292F8EF7|nr:NAD(P)H-binding protein [Pedobacter aquatilis]